MKKKLVVMLFLPIFLFVIAGCSTTTSSVNSSIEEGEPSLLDSLPPPPSDKAVLFGTIDLSPDQEFDSILFLSRNLSEGETDIPAALAFSYNNDPRANQNQDGEFVFTNVAPGQYAIVFWNIKGIKVVPSEESSGLFKLVDVKGGETINLGEISIP